MSLWSKKNPSFTDEPQFLLMIIYFVFEKNKREARTEEQQKKPVRNFLVIKFP